MESIMKLPEKEIKLRKRNKLVFGVGINDAEYHTQKHIQVNGRNVLVWRCPFYETWYQMLRRCYSKILHQKRPSYRDCQTCDEWLLFSNFKKWMETQDWRGKHLDKDLLVEGNKVYSPETSLFVDAIVNTFIIDRSLDRGDYMLGVHLDKRSGKFAARCNNPFTGKREWLGRFTDELEGHLAWKARKHELACQLADSKYVTDERLANVLRNKYK